MDGESEDSTEDEDATNAEESRGWRDWEIVDIRFRPGPVMLLHGESHCVACMRHMAS